MRVLIAVAVCLALPAPALAQDVQETTFGRAAAQVEYPLFKPTRTLGLKVHVTSLLNTCAKGANPREILATFGKPTGHGPQLHLYQARPYYCGNPGEALPYRTVRVLHRRVRVYAYCEALPRCRLIAGRKHGFLLGLHLRAGKQHRSHQRLPGLERRLVPPVRPRRPQPPPRQARPLAEPAGPPGELPVARRQGLVRDRLGRRLPLVHGGLVRCARVHSR